MATEEDTDTPIVDPGRAVYAQLLGGDVAVDCESVEPEQTQYPDVIPESGSAFCVEQLMKDVAVVWDWVWLAVPVILRGVTDTRLNAVAPVTASQSGVKGGAVKVPASHSTSSEDD